MILSKEEFYKLYVDVNEAEVFSEYCKIANQLGITFYNKEPADLAIKKGYRFISSDIPVQKGNLFWCDEIGMKERHGKVKSKLSDLKPRTKVEHEKLNQSNFNVWDLKPLLESGELYSKTSDGEYDQYSKSSPTYMLRHFMEYGVYRKVERPVEWWDDAVDYLNSNCKGVTAAGYCEDTNSIAIAGHMNQEQCYDFARILLEQEGE